MCQNKCQFTCSFIDCIRKAISKYKNAHSKIMQRGAEVSDDETDKTMKSFKCNYNNRYTFLNSLRIH